MPLDDVDGGRRRPASAAGPGSRRAAASSRAASAMAGVPVPPSASRGLCQGTLPPAVASRRYSTHDRHARAAGSSTGPITVSAPSSRTGTRRTGWAIAWRLSRSASSSVQEVRWTMAAPPVVFSAAAGPRTGTAPATAATAFASAAVAFVVIPLIVLLPTRPER